MLVKELAAARGVAVITQRRQLKSLVKSGEIDWQIDVDEIKANTEIPENVKDDVKRLDEGKSKDVARKNVKGKTGPKREARQKTETPVRVQAKKARVKNKDVAASLVVLADATAFAWIAFNGYEDFKYIATVFFFFVGIAAGYASMWSVRKYRGDYEELMVMFLWVIQATLHLSALKTFGPGSYYVGKIVVGIMIPSAGAVLSVASKSEEE